MNAMTAANNSDFTVAFAETAPSIERCTAVMRELRPHVPAAGFVARVQQQQSEGYQLAYLAAADEVRAVAGIRIFHRLFSGRTLYVDDLVTREVDRSRGYGAALFDWLVQHALAQECTTFTLDSGVQRFRAHRFYLLHGMDIAAHHFTMALPAAP